MIFVNYDIGSNRRRGKFSKFLKKFGRRLQYSMFELKNSARVLKNIMSEVECKYEPHFSSVDSVIILNLCEGCKKKIVRYGSAANEESDVVMF